MTDEERIPKPARPLDWLWPVDRAHLLYLLGTTILLIVHRTKAPGAHAWIVVNLVLLIALIVIVRRWTELASGSKARMVFTLAVIPIVFTQLGSLVPYVTSKGQEQALFDLDLWLCFGTNPVEATQHLANPWLTEVLQWVY
ncbi:MAG: hypothetical protein KDB18_14405, partial [Salinibacterium sp.]|nr:hypothetical protein [Salinibacterium sp.]